LRYVDDFETMRAAHRQPGRAFEWSCIDPVAEGSNRFNETFLMDGPTVRRGLLLRWTIYCAERCRSARSARSTTPRQVVRPTSPVAIVALVVLLHPSARIATFQC
jgi:hypothetical protein